MSKGKRVNIRVPLW